MADQKTDENAPEKNKEGFVRWHQKTIDERGKTINLFIGMAFATVGFVINELVKREFTFYSSYSKILILLGASMILVCIISLIWLILNRLLGFRITTKIARLKLNNQLEGIDSLRNRNKRIDKLTHKLFSVSLILFGISELFIVVGFAIQVSDKF